MCSNAECSLGIIACSLPPLRKLLKIYYKNWSSYKRDAQVILDGLRFGRYPQKFLPGMHELSHEQDDHVRNGGMILGPLRPQPDGLSSTHVESGNGRWHQLENDDSSRKGILQWVCDSKSFHHEA